jgi:EAL domain-containing protein (putative c-di-GMP-specific phosphodiesterase class I)
VADADAAMHQAKASGRARVITFDERMRGRSRDRLHMQFALRRAIDRGELHLVYQPQVDVASGQLVGVEALLRWTSDELGEVPPAEFIPLAEDSDLIMTIGAWVLQEACAQASRWRQMRGWAPLLSVNTSARQFGHPDACLDAMTGALCSSGLVPNQLRIEVTESTLGDPAATGPLVAKIKGLGVSLSIDDFGTGFSSLARLRSFPVDELKIDRSFVERLETHADDRAVVAAIIGMAKALHLDTVGEGVETAGQLDILRTLGCTRVQGYYLGRPIPGDDVTALLATR